MQSFGKHFFDFFPSTTLAKCASIRNTNRFRIIQNESKPAKTENRRDYDTTRKFFNFLLIFRGFSRRWIVGQKKRKVSKFFLDYFLTHVFLVCDKPSRLTEKLLCILFTNSRRIDVLESLFLAAPYLEKLSSLKFPAFVLYYEFLLFFLPLEELQSIRNLIGLLFSRAVI